ncbi:MAG: hypothetical protein VX519_05130 [Myxococcota bacterium]|nr:hypothetical protein [Myxococcota bacterium]
MGDLPTLPPGLLGWLSGSATVALLALFYVLFRQVVRGGRGQWGWALLPLFVLFLSFVSRRVFPGLHGPLAMLSLLVIAHNTWRFDGRDRLGSGVALVACLIAVALAVKLFS